MKRFARLAGSLAMVSPMLVFPAAGGVVHLTDGTVVEGEVHHTDEGWLVTTVTGQKVLIPADKVASLDARPKAAADTPEQALASLRRAADASPDIKRTLDRYKSFIDQYAGSVVIEKARADVAIWQDRLDRKMTRAGDKWLTPEERAAMRDKSSGTAAEGLRLMRQSHLRDAAPVLDQAINEDPHNPAALYLRGIVNYRQEQLPQARKSFEAVAAVLPDHAPTMNNLAVILWRQRSYVGALNFYDRALLAAPASREILDNMAEAINALPEESRNATATKKVLRHFAERDAAVAADLAKQGLVRWGATWVNSADYEKLQAAEKEIQGKLAKMSADYDAMSARNRRLEQDIDYTTQLARRMEADSYGRDASGNTVRYPLSPRYYDTLRDAAAMKSEHDANLIEMERLQKLAKQTQQQLPTPKFSGLQKLIDVEGTPLPPTSADVTARAGAPGPPVVAAVPVVAAAPPPTGPPVAPGAGAPAPAAPAAAASSTQPARKVVIPPEKPSIMDMDRPGARYPSP